MRAAGDTPDGVELELQTSFQSAIQSEKTSNQINQLAYELTDPGMAKTQAVKDLKKKLRIPEGEMNMDVIVDALERTIRIEAFTQLEEQDASGKFDEEDAPSRLVLPKSFS